MLWDGNEIAWNIMQIMQKSNDKSTNVNAPYSIYYKWR